MTNTLQENSVSVDLADSDGCHHAGAADHIYTAASESVAEKDGLALVLKTKFKNLAPVHSVWLEDLGKTVYVYIDAADTGKSTLHSIFNAQYDIEEEYPLLAFHFRVDSLELQTKSVNTRLRRII